MKKIFTLVMLSLFSVIYAKATEETLWEGDVNISWEDPAPTGTVKEWGAWSATAFPSDGYNHMKAIDTDNVVKVTLTKDFVTEAFVKKGGIAFWGNGGFKIKAIGTTKGSVMGTTGIDVRGKVTVDSDNTAQIYDLQGRKVANPTKGLYITNGKKFSVK